MSALTVMRAALKTAAAGVNSGGMAPALTFTAPRIKLGYVNLGANFFSMLASSGPYLLIEAGGAVPSRLDGRPGEVDYRDYEIPFKAWIGLARESDNDFTDPENLMEALVAAFEGISSDIFADFGPPVLDAKKNPLVVLYTGKVQIHGAV